MGAFQTFSQLYTSAALLFAGFCAALCYDLLLPACRACSRSLQWMMDIFLCFATALLIFMALYCTGSAALRAYMLFALLGGAVVYRFSIRRLLHFIVKHCKEKRKNEEHGE